MTPELRKEKRGSVIAQLLSFAAGFVDATGYIVLFHMFTANMSGNSVVLGIDLGRQKWGEILQRAFPIPLFMLGAVIAGLLLKIWARNGFRHFFAVVFILEAVLIGLFWLFGAPALSPESMHIESANFYTIAALPALAMGLQTVAFHRIGRFSVRTTFVTGMLTVFCRELVNYIFLVWDKYMKSKGSNPFSGSRKEASFVRMLTSGGIWLLYMAGAVSASYIILKLGLQMLAIPLLILLVMALADIFGSIDPDREREET